MATKNTKVRFRGNVYKVKWLGDSGSSLYLVGHEFGPTHLIGGSESAALEEYLDDCSPIDEKDVDSAFDENGDLRSEYEYQPNAGNGSGIVYLGHYFWMTEYSRHCS